MDYPRSKGTYGRMEGRTDEQVHEAFRIFFSLLKTPRNWRGMGWSTINDENGKVISVGVVFKDVKTWGIDLMHYKVAFVLPSESGIVVEKQTPEKSKYPYKTVVNNKTIDKINDYIKLNYSNSGKWGYWKRKTGIKRKRKKP